VKITKRKLREIILKETRRNRSSHRGSSRRSLASYLFEQGEAEEAAASTGKIGDAPRGDAVDKTTNVKDVDPIEIANQLLSGDDNAPVVAATQGQWFATSGAQAKEWIEKIGPEVFVGRLKALATKVPKTGLPKKIMPFLPGPGDAKGTFDQVEDALTPGGELNVDMMEEAALKRGLQYLVEKTPPPKANTFTGMDSSLETGAAAEFMTAGLKDGNETDDKVKIIQGGELAADKAIPTQSNILIYKALGMAMNPKNQIAGGDLDAWAGTGGEILDGHHRWAATMFNDPSASMGLAGQVDLGATGDAKEMLMYLTAIGNALGNVTKTEADWHEGDVILERWQKLSGMLK